MLEGPIIKDKSSFILTARRSMIDVFFKPFIRNKTPKYLFYDGSIKLNYSFSSQNRVFLTIFLGEDKIGDKNLFEEITFNQRNYQEIINQKYGWNNLASSLRWNYINSNNIIFNTQLNFSRYRYNDSYKYAFARIESGSAIKQTYNFDHSSGIQEIELNHSETYIFSKHNIKAGASFNLQRIDPDFNGFFSKTTSGKTTNDTILGNYAIKSTNYALFINDEVSVSQKFGFNAGLRYMGSLVERKFYSSIEPRLSLSYHASSNLTFKSAYSL
jgi:outer membrane receptor for ferrienterochelin and colicin